MPVVPTFPGIYIEELPSSAQTIAAAPTSVAAFVGYAHPFKTPDENWGQAVRVFSFADYEREFGGFFRADAFDRAVAAGEFADLALAVQQFFLNGGAVAHVVAVRPRVNGSALTRPTATVGGVEFTAREPVDDGHPLQVTVTVPGGVPGPFSFSQPASVPTAGAVADVTVTYGQGALARVETYRRVSLDPADQTNFIVKRIGTTASPLSVLVTVPELSGGFSFPTTWSVSPGGTATAAFGASPASGADVNLQVADFADVFRENGSLDKVPIVNLVVLPGVTSNFVLSQAVAFCERKRAFLIMDPPRPDPAADDPVAAGETAFEDAPKSKNAAIYFPYLTSSDPLTGDPIAIPPGGTVAGVFARTDLNRGVWKAPAGLEATTLNVRQVVRQGRMTDQEHGVLNQIGVNVLRDFPNVGTVVFGARTLAYATERQWGYVSVRRMALFLEQTLYANLRWVVFEPNDEPLWASIRATIEAFMLGLFRQGAFQGATPRQAFQVKCDAQTTTQADINNGIVNIVVAFAPLKPAEFVIVKIAQLAGQTA